MTIIYLVRHGESQANAGYRTTDPAQIPLTERGQRQAERVVPLLPAAPDLIVTSCYQRTKETAKPALAHFPHVAHEEWPVHEFTYLSPLHCTHMNTEERRPLVHHYWERGDAFSIDGPGAESWASFVDRAAHICTRLQHEAREKIVVFTHAQFTKMLVSIALGTRPGLTRTSIQRWRAWAELTPVGNGEIICLNYTMHHGWKHDDVRAAATARQR
jgi:2,3-bisphosphoglycerate-dependent phosphoglycerate mutase